MASKGPRIMQAFAKRLESVAKTQTHTGQLGVFLEVWNEFKLCGGQMHAYSELVLEMPNRIPDFDISEFLQNTVVAFKMFNFAMASQDKKFLKKTLTKDLWTTVKDVDNLVAINSVDDIHVLSSSIVAADAELGRVNVDFKYLIDGLNMPNPQQGFLEFFLFPERRETTDPEDEDIEWKIGMVA
eukprot:TRINITY_DN47946_c0_g2_i1.p1 TRINITY_DN47946_c0_g2~~TRINITY_DN47946_c0_g2_i1.p1  ORF type:complete len:184 (-),score=26.82 TRINITY_DN47946_c0_g2_i1:332-883(-)